MNTINVGFQTFVSRDRVLVILPATLSAPITRLRKAAKEKDLLLDATFGRQNRSVMILDTGHVILSAVNAETLVARMRRAPILDKYAHMP